MNQTSHETDAIWKALADGTRREILDILAERPNTTGELVAKFAHLCRTNVMKHVDILAAANLIIVRREGRVRWNYLNPAPIQSVCDRWVGKHVQQMAKALSRLKEHVEERERNEPKQKPPKKQTSSAKKSPQ
jgi:DNA-binding transcriptional ArsR family regulator